MRRSHFYIGFSLWTDVEQPPDRLMFKIWPISSLQAGDLPTTKALARIGYPTSSNAMMSLRPVILDDITTSVQNGKIQRSSNSDQYCLPCPIHSGLFSRFTRLPAFMPPASTLDESTAASSQDDGFSPSRDVRCRACHLTRN